MVTSSRPVIPIAAAAGAVTFLSPCCLPLVPGYLSYLTGISGAGEAAAADPEASAVAVAVAGQGAADGGVVTTRTRTASTGPAAPAKGRAVAGTALFVLGFSLVFATYGLALGGLGQLLRAHSTGLTQVLGGITILLGLMFAGVFDRFSFAGRIFRPSARPKAGLAGAPLLGVMFGLREAEPLNAFYFAPALSPGQNLATIFSTHPSLKRRLAELDKISKQLGQ